MDNATIPTPLSGDRRITDYISSHGKSAVAEEKNHDVISVGVRSHLILNNVDGPEPVDDECPGVEPVDDLDHLALGLKVDRLLHPDLPAPRELDERNGGFSKGLVLMGIEGDNVGDPVYQPLSRTCSTVWRLDLGR